MPKPPERDESATPAEFGAQSGQPPAARQEERGPSTRLLADTLAYNEGTEPVEPAGSEVRVKTSVFPSPPRSFGDYELLEELRRGGMGVIWKARQTRLNRLVALKLLLPGQAASSAAVRRFRAEAEAVADLEHPNIIPVYEVGEKGGQYFLAMKLIEGGDLSEHMQAFQTNHRAAARLMIKLARAVRFAHQRGIIHRDLKPANILIDCEGEPHITDFGLVKRNSGASRLTTSGMVMGTAGYMAPEQARGESKHVTWAADVYSLGAILYELLTGVPPFQTPTLQQTLRAVCEKDPVRPCTHNPTVDRDLETICLKCLRKDPERRYDSAKGFADDLERWLGGYPIRARRISRMARGRRWCKRNPAWTVLLLVVAAGLVAGSWAVNSRRMERAQLALQERDRIFRAVVEGRAALVGEKLRNIERVVVQYRKQAQQLMALPLERLPPRSLTPAGRDGVYYDEDFYQDGQGPPDLAYDPAYGSRVSWSEPTVVRPRFPPGEGSVDVSDDALRLARMNVVFSRVHPEQEDILWSYAGSASGVFTGFPGSGRYREKPSFDPRERTWYREAMRSESDRPLWTRPYSDASTSRFMISCVAPVRVEGTGVCVVGVDLPVERIQGWLEGLSETPDGIWCLVLMPFDEDPHPERTRTEYRVFVDSRLETEADHWQQVLDPTEINDLPHPLRDYAWSVVNHEPAHAGLAASARINALDWLILAVGDPPSNER